jgi:nuclear receptor subfamily 6 group A
MLLEREGWWSTSPVGWSGVVGQEQGNQGTGQRALNMERLWAGDLSQLPASQQLTALNLSSGGSGAPWGPVLKPSPPPPPTKLHDDPDEEDQPMICMICEDKATGLHYGIITCEGYVLTRFLILLWQPNVRVKVKHVEITKNFLYS